MTINEESEEQNSISVHELEPKELGSNVEAAYSREASGDFLTMAGAGDDKNFDVEHGRPS